MLLPLCLVQAYAVEDLQIGKNVKFIYKPEWGDGAKEQKKKGVVFAIRNLKYGVGVMLDGDKKPPMYIKNISNLQVPCYLSCIAPLLSSCLISEGVIPSLLACPTELAEL